MSRSRGFSLVEVLIAAAILLYAAWAFFSIYAVSARESVHSQMLYLADLTGDSVLEEVEAHQYGRSAPASWGLPQNRGVGEWQTVSYDVIVDSKKVKTVFHVRWQVENGSFLGSASVPSDRVSVVISWQEGEGEDPDYGAFNGVYFQGDNRHMIVEVPVWR